MRNVHTIQQGFEVWVIDLNAVLCIHTKEFAGEGNQPSFFRITLGMEGIENYSFMYRDLAEGRIVYNNILKAWRG